MHMYTYTYIYMHMYRERDTCTYTPTLAPSQDFLPEGYPPASFAKATLRAGSVLERHHR